MKSLAHEAAAVLLRNAREMEEIRSDLSTDIEINAFVGRELTRVPNYLLPLGGEIQRQTLLSSPELLLTDIKLPATSFTIEFNVSESGFQIEDTPRHVLPSFVRLALVQQLTDPRLFRIWEPLIAGALPKGEVLSPDSLLVVTVSRVSDPGAEFTIANHGWILGWAGALIDLQQAPFRIYEQQTPQGAYLANTMDITPVTMGYIGDQTLGRMLETVDVQHELAREYALEVIAAIDLGFAHANGKADLRRDPSGDRHLWRAGKGPRMPTRLLS